MKRQSTTLLVILAVGIVLLGLGFSLRGGPSTPERASPVWRIVQGAGVFLIVGSFVVWGLGTFGGKK